jgi:transposase
MAKTFCARPLGDRKKRLARLLGGRRLGIVLSDHTDDDGATISRHACRIRPLPDNLPVERIVEPPPCACGKCGSIRLRKLGEVVSKMLDCEPRRWKIVEHVREKFTCRDCEAITEPPAPSRPIPRGLAGPSLLAMVLVSKFLLHLPLNRQSDAYRRAETRYASRPRPHLRKRHGCYPAGRTSGRRT